MIILYTIGLDQSKHIVLEQEDHARQSRSNESKNREEENFSLWKCPKG